MFFALGRCQPETENTYPLHAPHTTTNYPLIQAASNYTPNNQSEIAEEILADVRPSVTVVDSPFVRLVEFDNSVEDAQQYACNVCYDHPYLFTSQLLQFDNLLEVTQQQTCHTNSEQPYPYTRQLLQLNSCVPCRPPELPHECAQIITPLVHMHWVQALREYPDTVFARYITEGIRCGFRIGFRHGQLRCQSALQNMPSAMVNPQPVTMYLGEERAAGRVLGPLIPAQVPSLQISRFGVIPKSNQPNKWRLILDLSHPTGFSVNDGIDTGMCSLKYTTVEEAVSRIVDCGRGTLLAKVDIQHAYRNIPVHPDDRLLLGMSWDGELLMDTVLPFGLRSAPMIFSAVADSLEWIFQHEGVTCSMHYLDDFLTMGLPQSQECAGNLERIQRVCHHLGVPLKIEKVEGPTTVLTFLGVELDTEAMELRLPVVKLNHLSQLLNEWQGKRACRKRELLSLIGKLSHATKVITPGRIFLRRMIDLSCKPKQLHHWVRLNEDFRSDLAWWICFLKTWNGRSVMDVHTLCWKPDITFSTDASGSWGCGAVWKDRWIQAPWEGVWADQSIAAKELLPIVLACALWGPHWVGKQVLVLCDNAAAVQVLTTHTSRVPRMMHLLRCLHFIVAHFDIKLRAEHLSGVLNTLADAVSRNSLQALRQLHPTLESQATPVPAALWHLLVVVRPDWTSPTWSSLLTTSLGIAWQSAPSGCMGRHRHAT